MEELAWSAELRLSALTSLAQVHILGHVAVLTDPEGEAMYQLPCLGAAKVTSADNGPKDHCQPDEHENQTPGPVTWYQLGG
jgi:hypothetical protein